MRTLALVALCLILAGCATPPADPYASRAPDGSDTHTVAIPHQQVFSSPPFGVPGRPIHARVTWNATQRLDAWIAAGAQCQAYGTRGFAPAAAMLDSTGGVIAADLPEGVAHCFIVDNTDFGGGQSPAGPDASMTYTLDVWMR